MHFDKEEKKSDKKKLTITLADMIQLQEKKEKKISFPLLVEDADFDEEPDNSSNEGKVQKKSVKNDKDYIWEQVSMKQFYEYYPDNFPRQFLRARQGHRSKISIQLATLFVSEELSVTELRKKTHHSLYGIFRYILNNVLKKLCRLLILSCNLIPKLDETKTFRMLTPFSRCRQWMAPNNVTTFFKLIRLEFQISQEQITVSELLDFVKVIQLFEIENYGLPPLIISIPDRPKKINGRKLAVDEPPYSMRNNMLTFKKQISHLFLILKNEQEVYRQISRRHPTSSFSFAQITSTIKQAILCGLRKIYYYTLRRYKNLVPLINTSYKKCRQLISIFTDIKSKVFLIQASLALAPIDKNVVTQCINYINKVISQQ